jgi:hypothetical protein
MTIKRGRIAFVFVISATLAACGSGSASLAVSPDEGVATSEPTGAIGSPLAQTETDWGRIWDRLPAGFPTVPGSTPGAETATGAASANLVVDGTEAQEIATSMQTQLVQAGFAIDGLSGPLEDGGYVLDMTGSEAGCVLQVSVSPMGGLTAITILYGAACPID